MKNSATSRSPKAPSTSKSLRRGVAAKKRSQILQRVTQKRVVRERGVDAIGVRNYSKRFNSKEGIIKNKVKRMIQRGTKTLANIFENAGTEVRKNGYDKVGRNLQYIGKNLLR